LSATVSGRLRVYELAVIVVVACCLLPLVRAVLTVSDRLLTAVFFPAERAHRLRNEAFLPAGRAHRLRSEAAYRRRTQAAERAHWLLERNLNAEQQRTFATGGFIDVRASGGRVYRIEGDGFVGRLSEDEKSLTAQYCIMPTVAMPVADRLLALKLMLETAEEEFLRTAHHLGRPA